MRKKSFFPQKLISKKSSKMIKVIVATLMALNLVDAQKYYASKYDHLDVNAILNNRRMVNYYAKCLLNQGPCPPQGTELKNILPEALTTNCGRCSEKQQTVAYYSIRRLKKEYPKIWEQLRDLYDPDEEAIRKFEAGFEKPTTTEAVVSLADRFGEDDNNNNVAPSVVPAAPPSQTPAPAVPLAPYPAALPASSSTSTSTSTTSTTTRRPFTSSTTTSRPASNYNPPASFVPSRPGRPPIRNPIGANIQATVSFGTNIVGGIVRGLGDLGRNVVQTGAQIADAVISVVVPRQ